MIRKRQRGFTLIELLIVMTVISILAGISIFSMDNARQSARDGRRKSDLESIASGFELYKADCGIYPPAGSANVGTTLTASCPNAVTYHEDIPGDPQGGSYCYNRISDVRFQLCTDLENDPPSAASCGGACVGNDYRVTSP